MLLSRKVYDDLRYELVKTQQEAAATKITNAQLATHLEWLERRLMQLELERAQLLKRYMNIDIPVPTVESVEDMPDINSTIDFSDVGDEMAAKLGINWRPDGTAHYSKA